jgi:death-on-curing protein
VTHNEALVLHDRLIVEIGGMHGVRDIGLFLSALERPKAQMFGREPHKTIHQKAAAYFEAFARYHVFVDGNKRTAFAVCAWFLFVNGYVFAASRKEIEVCVLAVAQGERTYKELVNWLKRRTKKYVH